MTEYSIYVRIEVDITPCGWDILRFHWLEGKPPY